jgi:hypothetical protein
MIEKTECRLQMFESESFFFCGGGDILGLETLFMQMVRFHEDDLFSP